MSTLEYQVTGMTCDDIQVSAQTGKLVVSGSDDIDDAQVLAAVEEAGYTAARI